jgi:signal transduction histidine kinase
VSTSPAEVHLRDYLGAQLRPLAVVLAAFVMVTAPTAFYVLGMRALRVQAQVASQQVGAVIRSDIERRPAMWKYDAVKLIEHIRSYELQESIARVEVVDDYDRPIDPRYAEVLGDLERRRPLWQMSEVIVNNAVVARVWVAMSTVELRQQAWLLAAGFGGLALVLAGLVYWLPMRAVGRAEHEIRALLGRLEASKAELAALNAGLERLVEVRSSALSNALAEVHQKEQRLREISLGAVELQEEQQRAIARDLHDSAGQTLTAIRINLQLLGNLLEQAKPEQLARIKDLAARSTALVDETVEEIRRAVRSLGPAVIEDVGLVRALERMCEDVEHRTSVLVEHEIRLGDRAPIPAIETTCYRVVQEGLTNAIKHSRAGHVTVAVVADDDSIRVDVVDDGIGIGDTDLGHGHGLVGMRERVELLGGRLDIGPERDGGTRLTAKIPLRQS